MTSSESDKPDKPKSPKVAPSLYPPSLMLSEAEFKALQQRKLALGEYATKVFAEERRSSNKPE